MSDGVDAASFEFYEGIRIFIPGAITVGIVAAINVTFGLTDVNLTQSGVNAILAALALGLLFYFVDAPAKAASFKSLQPTELLDSWGLKARGVSTLNAYLLMLDTDIPGAIRARALYMGSMYRIGFELIYLLLLSSVGVLLAASTSDLPRAEGRPADASSLDRYLIVGAVLLTYFVALRRDLISRSPRRPHDLPLRILFIKKLSRQSQRVGPFDVRPIHFSSIDALFVAAAASGFLLLIWRNPEGYDELRILPAALVLALWAFRYFRGYRRSYWNAGVPIDAVHACFLAVASVLLAFGCIYRAEPRLSTLQERGWSALAIVALILIVSRGHERRLRGAYSSQNTWLVQNKADVVSRYFTKADVAPLAGKEIPPTEAAEGSAASGGAAPAG
jgi:hypothetical protein